MLIWRSYFSLQLEQKDDQQKLLQNTVDEKRLQLVETEKMLKEVEDKYYSASANKIQEKTVNDLRVKGYFFS